MIISVLKLTRNGPVLTEHVKTDAKIPLAVAIKLLERLQSEDMLYLKRGVVEADSSSRLKLAVKALSLGADVERVAELLRWQEFENVAAMALSNNGYVVSENSRFKQGGRRWEIDVVGCKKPTVICIDCKHWHHRLSSSALAKIVDAQAERTKALAESLPNVSINLGCVEWNTAKFVPTILALLPSSVKFYETVPIVPVLQLQDFLEQLPAHVGSLRHFNRDFSHLCDDF
jgi:Holliday junction resolvase-like predicted endonuclease